MHRWARFLLIGVLGGVTVALTLGPLPVRPLTDLTSVVSGITGASQGVLRPVVEAASNVVLFVALAVALMIAAPRLVWWHVAVSLIVASAGIELAQALLLTGRHAEPRDVVLNGTGALLGGCAVGMARRVRVGHDVEATTTGRKGTSS